MHPQRASALESDGLRWSLTSVTLCVVLGRRCNFLATVSPTVKSRLKFVEQRLTHYDCISYLLLCYKLPCNLGVSNNKYLLSHSFCE